MDKVPDDPLAFIRACMHARAVCWTYYVNMRLLKRSIDRQSLFEAVDTYEIIESYPEDKYLPSYLVYFITNGQAHRAVIAADLANANVRIVTVYRPDPGQWSSDMRRRNSP